MLRRLFTVASMLSLVLCLAAAALCVWSYRPTGGRSRLRGVYARGEYEAGSRPGELSFQVRPYPQAFVLSTVVDGKRVPTSGPIPVIGNSSYAVQSDPPSGVVGVRWWESWSPIPMTFGPPLRQVYSRTLAVSLWLPCFAFALLPALWPARRKRSRRHGPGLCEHCGYRLTGNVSGVCPECGLPVSAPTQRA